MIPFCQISVLYCQAGSSSVKSQREKPVIVRPILEVLKEYLPSTISAGKLEEYADMQL